MTHRSATSFSKVEVRTDSEYVHHGLRGLLLGFSEHSVTEKREPTKNVQNVHHESPSPSIPTRNTIAIMKSHHEKSDWLFVFTGPCCFLLISIFCLLLTEVSMKHTTFPLVCTYCITLHTAVPSIRIQESLSNTPIFIA